MGNEVSVWNKVLSTALAMPGVKVNRKEYLTHILSMYCMPEDVKKAIATCPAMVVNEKLIEKLANDVMGSHLKTVTSLSAVSGLPGGWALAATIPADMAQYYYHVLVLSQKLAYLYGVPSLCDENNNLTDEAIDMLTIFVGVMSGVNIANQALKTISEALAKQVANRLPRIALTKFMTYRIAKDVAKWLGVSLTKATFSRGVAKFVPVLGAGISGSITYVTFKKQSKRLNERLQENMPLYKGAYVKAEQNDNSDKGAYTDFQEI